MRRESGGSDLAEESAIFHSNHQNLNHPVTLNDEENLVAKSTLNDFSFTTVYSRTVESEKG